MPRDRNCDFRVLRSFAAYLLAASVAFSLTLPAFGQAREGSQQQIKSLSADIFSNWIEETKSDGSLDVVNFVLADVGSVNLILHKVNDSGKATQFVVGNPGGGHRPFPYQSSSVAIYRGQVENHPESRVFFGISNTLTLGYVDLGSSGAQYWISSNSAKTEIAKAGEFGSAPPNIPMCGLQAADIPSPPRALPAQLDTLPPTPRVLELAIETDYELFELFGDLKTEADYISLLYAAMSDIYLRDANISVELTYVRLWDTSDDLFNQENPLNEFREYWNDNMQFVVRDAAQFFSGRRDMPFGGIAYLGTICGNAAYSVVGYALGFSPDPSMPSAFHYDLHVTAHELGHNCDALHSHDYEIDDCDSFEGVARRGTIMSYCSQTRSGGNANTDLRFHEIVKVVMREFFDTIDCLYFDCNDNGVSDNIDILEGDSQDLNSNGVPDECEDCNDNGQLDTIDIDKGESTDLNNNLIPDECEPDCNSNDIPDDLDILNGESDDIHGNGIPDECEADCNSDGVADYNEILDDMTLDIDRNTILDDCQDCDEDGINDLVALNSAHNIWVASFDDLGAPKEFHAVSGAMVRVGQSGVFDSGEDLLITPDGRILISSGNEDRVVEVDGAGQFLRDFVPAGSGGLDRPTGMAIAPNGNLIVASRENHSVLEYHGLTGMFIRELVQSESGGLAWPHGVAYGPDGNLYVTSALADSQQVLRYDGTTGEFLDAFVSVEDNGGLTLPRGLLFKPNGNLLVASLFTNQILEYDGKSGAFIGQFNHGGTETALTLDRPWGLRLGPTGNVFVSRHFIDGERAGGGDDTTNLIQQLHINSTRIFEFDVDSGIFLRSFVLGHDTDLWRPTGFDFMPSLGNDCNFNMIPDSCDIAGGLLHDENGNGFPDECETPGSPGDLDGDGHVTTSDLLILLSNWGPCDDCNMCLGDLNNDCTVSTGDLLMLLTNWG